MDLLSDLVKILIGSLGTFGIIVVILALNPEKIEIWASWLYRGARIVSRRAEYGLIAHDVAGNINSHLRKDLIPYVSGLSATGVSIHWHNSAKTVVHEAEGTVFVRMRPHDERFANIFQVTLAAAPRLVAPTLRSQIHANDSKAIDLQLCRRLAEKMSQSAIVGFRISVLDPILKNEPDLEPILHQFNTIELGGLFLPLFIQELVKLGTAYPVDNLKGIDSEVTKFYKFLTDIAEKPRGTDVNLAFLGLYIRVHVLLVAKPETKAAGIDPYRWRVGRSLAQGAQTIYVLASGTNVVFAEEVVDALDGDFRITKGPTIRNPVFRDGVQTPAFLVPFERNEGYFCGAPSELGPAPEEIITKGTRRAARVVHVSPGFVTVDLDGIQAFIRSLDLSWEYVKNCEDFVKLEDTFEVEITGTDPTCLEIYASRKVCIANPMDSVSNTETVGTVVTMRVKGYEGKPSPKRFCFGIVDGQEVPIRVYEDEIEWGTSDHNPAGRIPTGTIMPVKVLDVDKEIGFLVCSRKQVLAGKWNDIRQEYPRGKEITVAVTRIDGAGAICEVAPGLVGLVPESEFMLAGLEYRDFRTNVKPGQKLYVVVGRVTAGRKERLSLCLRRNVPSYRVV